jgi:hypothetical protein
MQTAARRTAALFAKERCALKSLSFYNWIRNQTRKERRQLAADPWHALQHKIRMEWELLSQKARCAMHALLTEPDPEELARDRAV